MKLLFLDIDGVLNNSNFHELTQNKFYGDDAQEPIHHISQHNVDMLKLIVEKTHSSIVLSSTWRKSERFLKHAFHGSESDKIQFVQDFFTHFGWHNFPIIGFTPVLSGFRGEEVAVFLDSFSQHTPVEDYIILDDDSDFIYPDSVLSPYHLDKIERCYKINPEYWSNQHLLQINPLQGLSYEDVVKVLKMWSPSDNLVLEHEAYEKQRTIYGKKF